MVDLVLGIAAAVGASVFYSLGIALQAMDAKEAPHDEHLRLALGWGLVRRGRWMLGTGLSILGWPLQVLALLLAPLVVVQAGLGAGLVVLGVVRPRAARGRARAGVRRTADARRARRAPRARGDGGDRDRGDRRGSVRAPAQHDP